ncbi:MFS general substrate transporter [Mycena vulgaris]|nr:MFS general substrate transporter [Mycena vulgaris]
MTTPSPENVSHPIRDKGILDTGPRPEESGLPAPQDPMSVPDGGLTAWTTIAGAWLILFATSGYMFSFGVYEDFYVLEYLTNHSPSSIAWIGSFQLMSPFILGLFSGKLFDAGHFYTLQICGGAIFTFSLFMLSLAKPQQYYQIFLSQGVGMGLGLGCTYLPSATIAVHHFARRRGLASGIALSGGALGSTVFPIMLNHLIPRIGFAGAVRATGYVVLGCILVGNTLMRTRFPRRSQRKDAPKMISFLTDAPYMWTVLGISIANIGNAFPLTYIQLFAEQHSTSGGVVFYSIAAMNAAGVIGRIAGNYLGDIQGPVKVQAYFTFLAGAMIWAVLGIHNSWSLLLVSVLFGIFSGGWAALSFLCLSSFAKSPSEIGARTGLALVFVGITSLISTPLQGVVLTTRFIWIRPIVFSAVLMFVGALCLVVTLVLRRRPH